MNWVPGPILAPSPSRNSGTSGPSIPPLRDSTTPERRFATRTPAWLAGRAAASQSRTRWARKPVPAGADSSTSRVPVSPYQPIAEPDSSTDGGFAALPMAVTRALVLWIRLERSSAFLALVHRPPAIGAPERWTTPSSPSSAAGSSPPSGSRGFHAISSGSRGERRTSRTTSLPSRCRSSASADPISPDDPVIATRIDPPLQPKLGLERAFF